MRLRFDIFPFIPLFLLPFLGTGCGIEKTLEDIAIKEAQATQVKGLRVLSVSEGKVVLAWDPHPSNKVVKYAIYLVFTPNPSTTATAPSFKTLRMRWLSSSPSSLPPTRYRPLASSPAKVGEVDAPATTFTHSVSQYGSGKYAYTIRGVLSTRDETLPSDPAIVCLDQNLNPYDCATPPSGGSSGGGSTSGGSTSGGSTSGGSTSGGSTSGGGDTTPPETTILSGPSDPTSSTSVSFTFTCSEAGCTFECRFDGNPWTSCTSPQNYSDLTDGAHTFEVRARDLAGNFDPTPAVWYFTVNTGGGGSTSGGSTSGGSTSGGSTSGGSTSGGSTSGGSTLDLCSLPGDAIRIQNATPPDGSVIPSGSQTFSLTVEYRLSSTTSTDLVVEVDDANFDPITSQTVVVSGSCGTQGFSIPVTLAPGSATDVIYVAAWSPSLPILDVLNDIVSPSSDWVSILLTDPADGSFLNPGAIAVTATVQYNLSSTTSSDLVYRVVDDSFSPLDFQSLPVSSGTNSVTFTSNLSLQCQRMVYVWVLLTSTDRLDLVGFPVRFSCLFVSPSSLIFSADPSGPNPPPQTLSLSGNPGISFSASEDQPWLSLSPSLGVLPTDSTLTVSVDIAGLSVGRYTGTITITSPQASNTPITVPVTLAIANNYTVTPAPFSWDPSADPPTNGTVAIPNGQDITSFYLALPFTFSFYGTGYDAVYVDSKGRLNFYGPISFYWNFPFPCDTSECQLVIAPFWGDLVTFNPGSEVRYAIVGSAPNRRVVITWWDMAHYGGYTDSSTFQVILYEGSNEILFQYQTVSSLGGETVGVNLGDGVHATTLSLASVTDSTAFRFSPP